MPETFTENQAEKMVLNACEVAGWKYIPSDQLDRDHGSVLVESMVKAALIRLNPCIADHPEHADTVIYKLRSLISTVQAHDLVTQNERFKKLVFEENSFPFAPDGRSVSIRFFDYDDLSQNEFVVTNQWIYPNVSGGKRLDIVMLINGFPVIIGEMKSPTRPSISWVDGAQDISKYEQSIPQMFVTNIFNFASEGKCFRYGSICAPVTVWGPWYAGIEHREGTFAEVIDAVVSIMKPEVVLDIFRYFTLFSTDKRNRKIKVICRYQQYEGANMIVKRVKAGYPKKGLIWHFQGSGKSLLMVFAAMKLRMMKELESPTIIIVNDRIDLEGQIAGTFTMADVPNLESVSSCEELEVKLKSDIRKVLITTIFKFEKVTHALNYRDNIILMVDEAHRTQEGDLGLKMRTALPNAFFFGLTGTPVNRLDRNTFRTFGALEDKSGYMSRYTFGDSVKDGATLPLHFEAVPVKLHVQQDVIDEEFARLAEEANLTDEQRNKIAKRVKVEAIMKDPTRIHAVCEHIAQHFMEKVNPNGFKGQVVCYDRECCVLYKQELDKLLGSQTSTIVMDTNNDKENRYREWRRDRDEEARVLDDFRDPNNPLQLVIVTSKLLTGFDAPILQVMYLDKPMKDHTLLQAICRTNRIYNSEKSYGLIVDYIGIFDHLAKALDFDDESTQKIITNIDSLRGHVGELIEKCVLYFPGVDRTATEWDSLLIAQNCLPTNKEKDEFGADYRLLNRVWNALSPDSCLVPYKQDYVWLSKVYQSVRPGDITGKLIWASLGNKTLQLVHDNITSEETIVSEKTIALDSEMLEKMIGNEESSRKKAKKLEMDLVAFIHMHDHDERYIALGKRVEELRLAVESGLMNSIEFIKTLLEIAREAAQMERNSPPVGSEERGKSALTKLFETVKRDNTPLIVERLVADIDGLVKGVRFPGWKNTSEGRKTITRSLREVIMVKYKIRDKEVFRKACEYVEQYY